METLEALDRQLFLFLNSFHSVYLDELMYLVTKIAIFTPLFAYWIYHLYKKYQPKKMLVLLPFIALLITITDQSATQTKESVKRYRPTHNVEIGHQVHVVRDYRGGDHGFFSGHASNTFGVATLLFWMLSNKSIAFRSTFFLWAGLTSYSRIYLGVHYPSDILLGMLVGIAAGTLIFYMLNYTFKKHFNYNSLAH